MKENKLLKKGKWIVLFLALIITTALIVQGFKLTTSHSAGLPENGMLLMKGGKFNMGTPDENSHAHKGHLVKTSHGNADVKDPAHGIGDDDERPAHQVTLSPFNIDATEVTNAEFARFVAATGYKTDAEKKGSSWIFKKGMSDWQLVDGADWRHPFGTDSSIDDKMNHPVVHVSWNDATAYAKWVGKRLPTEAEWEYVARSGHEGEIYPWGNELKPGGKAIANFWQGTWPDNNLLEDNFYYTAPVASFAANDFGVYDIIGNVWEWTADWYAEDYYKRSPAKDPKGASSGEMRVARGGSWFCSDNYCGAYRVGFRGKSPQDATFNNLGFRCAKDAQR
jgi:formylglycine-generating enzyme required for sulfatase activity